MNLLLRSVYGIPYTELRRIKQWKIPYSAEFQKVTSVNTLIKAQDSNPSVSESLVQTESCFQVSTKNMIFIKI
jgi:hypothetical protein